MSESMILAHREQIEWCMRLREVLLLLRTLGCPDAKAVEPFEATWFDSLLGVSLGEPRHMSNVVTFWVDGEIESAAHWPDVVDHAKWFTSEVLKRS